MCVANWGPRLLPVLIFRDSSANHTTKNFFLRRCCLYMALFSLRIKPVKASSVCLRVTSFFKSCNDLAEPAQFMQLMQMLQLGFSYSTPGVGAGSCKSVSSRQSRGWHAARFRSGAGGHIAL